MEKINPYMFAERLKNFMYRNRYTKERLCREVKCGTRTLEKWLNVEKTPTKAQIERLKEIMGVKNTEALSAPYCREHTSEMIDGYTIEGWRARALYAEAQLKRLNPPLFDYFVEIPEK